MEIRTARVEDAKELLAIYTPYVLETAITFETEVPSLEEFEHRITDTQASYPYLVAEEAGQVLGYAYAHAYYGRAAYAWTVEVSVYVEKAARATGVGTALYNQLEELLIEQGMTQALACISLPNDASITFHKKRGYEQVAHFKKVGYKLGQWRDIVWLQKELKDIANPTE